MAEEKKKNWLRTAFVAASWGVAASVGMNLLWDLTFMPIIHDTGNLKAQAAIEALKPFTSWIPYHLGITNESGGLLSGVTDTLLSGELAEVRRVREFAGNATTAAGLPMDLSMDDLSL